MINEYFVKSCMSCKGYDNKCNFYESLEPEKSKICYIHEVYKNDLAKQRERQQDPTTNVEVTFPDLDNIEEVLKELQILKNNEDITKALG